MAILQIALTAHISFLLWELIIWQTRSWQIYLPSNGDFTDSCSALTAHYLPDPCQLVISQIPGWNLFPIPESSTFDRPILAQLPPSSKAIWQLRTLVWELIFDRPGVGRSTPHQMAISQIPALTAHIWWQLIFHSYSESFIIWQTRSWQIYLPSNECNFTDSYSDNSYFTTLRTYHLTHQVLAYLPPPSNSAIS